MDQNLLVSAQIDAGALLITMLEKTIPIQAAFWLQANVMMFTALEDRKIAGNATLEHVDVHRRGVTVPFKTLVF